jgi:hypothetical protein
MLILTVKHPVEDYSRWREAFDGFAGPRAASGAKFERVLQDADDPNLVTVLMGFESREKADAFLALPELKDTMMAAGVSAPPQFSFMNEVGKFDY